MSQPSVDDRVVLSSVECDPEFPVSQVSGGKGRSLPKGLDLRGVVALAGVGSLDVMLGVTASRSRFNLQILGNSGGGR